VQGKCATCESPIPAAQRLCPACRQREQEAKENTHAWRSPTGEEVKRQVARVRVSARVVFDILGPRGRQFTLESPSGPFLETLIGVCYQRPPYIRATDVARYASLIDSLMHFQSCLHPWEQDSPMVAVQDISLDRLGVAVREWITSFFGEQHHPLMATYALDTACFVAAHGEGTHFSSDRSLAALLQPMVDGDFSIRCLCDPTFKGDFTQRSAGRELVLAEIPDGGAVVSADQKSLGPGTTFLFRITRCHLSEAWNEYGDLEIREKNSPDYDIGAVSLPGRLLLDASGSITVSPTHVGYGRESPLHVPLRWITHAVCDNRLLPVPQWQ
jgi:hypothetical protein